MDFSHNILKWPKDLIKDWVSSEIPKQELKALLDPELSIITTFLEIFDDKNAWIDRLFRNHPWRDWLARFKKEYQIKKNMHTL